MRSQNSNSDSPDSSPAASHALRGQGVPVDRKQAFRHIRFAVSAVYRDFEKRWGWLPQPHDFWVNHWAGELTEFPVAAIRMAARDATAWETSSPPSLSEFKAICRQVMPSITPVGYADRESRIDMVERFLRESLSENAPSEMESAKAHLEAAALLLARANLVDDIPWDTKAMQQDFYYLAAEAGVKSLDAAKAAAEGEGRFADHLRIVVDDEDDN